MLFRFFLAVLFSVAVVTFTLDWIDLLPQWTNPLLRTRRPHRSNSEAFSSSSLSSSSSSTTLSFFRELERRTGGGNLQSHADRGLLNQVAARYLLQPPTTPLGSFVPPDMDLNCAHVAYSHVLAGEQQQQHQDASNHQTTTLTAKGRYIVDVVAFGFDVDYLEIRLLENFDLVDKFVIVEQNVTHRGVAKPFLLELLLRSDRFRRFASKIEYLQDHVPQQAIQALNKDKYALENRVRSIPIQYLRKTMQDTVQSRDEILVLQNDGDEIINRRVLSHLKYCPFRDNVSFPIYTPSLAFKRNVAWLQSRPDMKTMTLADPSIVSRKLREVAWRHPFVWTWEHVEKEGSTHRRHGIDNTKFFNMGVAAAVHFSDPAHPILAMLKFFSVAESVQHSFSADFWKTIRQGRMDERDILEELFKCKTSGEHRWHHVGELGETTQAYVMEQLPWALRQNPARYAWLYSPGLTEREQELYQRKCDKESTKMDER